MGKEYYFVLIMDDFAKALEAELNSECSTKETRDVFREIIDKHLYTPDGKKLLTEIFKTLGSKILPPEHIKNLQDPKTLKLSNEEYITLRTYFEEMEIKEP